MFIYLLFSLLSIVTIVLQVQKTALVQHKDEWHREVAAGDALCVILEYILIIITAWWGLPSCVFLVAYFLIECIYAYRSQGKNDMIKWFFRMNFLILACSMMILLGIAATGGRNVAVISREREMRFIILIVAEILDVVFCTLWKYFFHSSRVEDDNRDSRKTKLFLVFLWCCIAYVYIDSVLCLFPFKGVFVPLLLISGNILTLILVFWFLRHNYIIAKNQIWEREYEELQAQKARLLYRQEQMDAIAKIDGLTGAYTRRYGCTLLEQMISKGVPLTVVFIDLDGLKKVNDEKGHAAGDRCLKRFTEEFVRRLRSNDLFIRLGGDEFLAVLPHAPEEKVQEKMLVMREEFRAGENELLPFSFGTASKGEKIEELIKQADKNMYQDKKRNK